MCSPKRVYRKTKRAEDETRTSARIVDAAEALHGTVGPANTTVSAIAERAGVTRATVYRHFPDDESLFLACSGQWMSRQRPPDPDRWSAVDDALVRLREGLADIYRYYRDGEQMLTLVHRDVDVVPAQVLANRTSAERRWLETLVQPFPGRRRMGLHAAVAHATSFTTWRSLCVDQTLPDPAAVDLMVGMVAAAREDPTT